MNRQTRTVVLPVAVLILVVGAAAFAYWRSTGGGTAAAATGTTSALTLSPATATAQLYPGGQASVALTVTNSNAFSVRVGSFARDTGQGSNGYAVDGGHSGCALSALSFTTQTNGGAGWTVSGSATMGITLTNALSMTTGAANACQGAAFTVYLKALP